MEHNVSTTLWSEPKHDQGQASHSPLSHNLQVILDTLVVDVVALSGFERSHFDLLFSNGSHRPGCVESQGRGGHAGSVTETGGQHDATSVWMVQVRDASKRRERVVVPSCGVCVYMCILISREMVAKRTHPMAFGYGRSETRYCPLSSSSLAHRLGPHRLYLGLRKIHCT